MTRPVSILRTVIALAIREQRLLSLTHVRAIEPQLFAPVPLYVNASNRVILEGYEVRGETVRWRELELMQARCAADPTELCPDNATPLAKRYALGATVIAQASVPGL